MGCPGRGGPKPGPAGRTDMNRLCNQAEVQTLLKGSTVCHWCYAVDTQLAPPTQGSVWACKLDAAAYT